MSTQLDERTDEKLGTGEAKAAHIVATDGDTPATAVVLEARIYGTPVEALCGQRFIPSRDPGKLPKCQKCKEIYDTIRGMVERAGGHLNETPQA